MQLPKDFPCISSVLLYLLFLPLSQTLPSPPPPELISPLTTAPTALPSPTSQNLTSAASNGRCASRANFPTWYASNWLVEDCYAALQQLYIKETMLHPNQEYEFLQPGASRKDLNIPSQKTPRKYIVNSCVLTIMMLDWFGPGSLPNPFSPSPVGRTQTDVSTYQKIWAAGKRLEYACPDENKSPGWCVVGDRNAMGVFIWATDSVINSRVRGVPIVELANVNVSVTGAIDIGETS